MPARMLHEYASNLAKLVVRQGFQRLLKKYDSPPSYRLASPHLFWHVMQAHAPSTRATAMIAVASTRLTRQPGVILCTDALMPRRQESRTAMSPTRATYGPARPDRCLREEALRRRAFHAPGITVLHRRRRFLRDGEWRRIGETINKSICRSLPPRSRRRP